MEHLVRGAHTSLLKFDGILPRHEEDSRAAASWCRGQQNETPARTNTARRTAVRETYCQFNAPQVSSSSSASFRVFTRSELWKYRWSHKASESPSLSDVTFLPFDRRIWMSPVVLATRSSSSSRADLPFKFAMLFCLPRQQGSTR
jgi:hypothetical protein